MHSAFISLTLTLTLSLDFIDHSLIRPNLIEHYMDTVDWTG